MQNGFPPGSVLNADSGEGGDGCNLGIGARSLWSDLLPRQFSALRVYFVAGFCCCLLHLKVTDLPAKLFLVIGCRVRWRAMICAEVTFPTGFPESRGFQSGKLSRERRRAHVLGNAGLNEPGGFQLFKTFITPDLSLELLDRRVLRPIIHAGDVPDGVHEVLSRKERNDDAGKDAPLQRDVFREDYDPTHGGQDAGRDCVDHQGLA